MNLMSSVNRLQQIIFGNDEKQHLCSEALTKLFLYSPKNLDGFEHAERIGLTLSLYGQDIKSQELLKISRSISKEYSNILLLILLISDIKSLIQSKGPKRDPIGNPIQSLLNSIPSLLPYGQRSTNSKSIYTLNSLSNNDNNSKIIESSKMDFERFIKLRFSDVRSNNIKCLEESATSKFIQQLLCGYRTDFTDIVDGKIYQTAEVRFEHHTYTSTKCLLKKFIDIGNTRINLMKLLKGNALSYEIRKHLTKFDAYVSILNNNSPAALLTKIKSFHQVFQWLIRLLNMPSFSDLHEELIMASHTHFKSDLSMRLWIAAFQENARPYYMFAFLSDIDTEPEFQKVFLPIQFECSAAGKLLRLLRDAVPSHPLFDLADEFMERFLKLENCLDEYSQKSKDSIKNIETQWITFHDENQKQKLKQFEMEKFEIRDNLHQAELLILLKMKEDEKQKQERLEQLQKEIDSFDKLRREKEKNEKEESKKYIENLVANKAVTPLYRPLNEEEQIMVEKEKLDLFMEFREQMKELGATDETIMNFFPELNLPENELEALGINYQTGDEEEEMPEIEEETITETYDNETTTNQQINEDSMEEIKNEILEENKVNKLEESKTRWNEIKKKENVKSKKEESSERWKKIKKDEKKFEAQSLDKHEESTQRWKKVNRIDENSKTSGKSKKDESTERWKKFHPKESPKNDKQTDSQKRWDKIKATEFSHKKKKESQDRWNKLKQSDSPVRTIRRRSPLIRNEFEITDSNLFIDDQTEKDISYLTNINMNNIVDDDDEEEEEEETEEKHDEKVNANTNGDKETNKQGDTKGQQNLSPKSSATNDDHSYHESQENDINQNQKDSDNNKSDGGEDDHNNSQEKTVSKSSKPLKTIPALYHRLVLPSFKIHYNIVSMALFSILKSRNQFQKQILALSKTFLISASSESDEFIKLFSNIPYGPGSFIRIGKSFANIATNLGFEGTIQIGTLAEPPQSVSELIERINVMPIEVNPDPIFKILITDSIIQSYTAIFRLILMLKLARAAVDRMWFLTRDSYNHRPDSRASALMLRFVICAETYFHATALAPAAKALEKVCDDVDTIEDFNKKHEGILRTLMAMSLLSPTTKAIRVPLLQSLVEICKYVYEPLINGTKVSINAFEESAGKFALILHELNSAISENQMFRFLDTLFSDFMIR